MDSKPAVLETVVSRDGQKRPDLFIAIIIKQLFVYSCHTICRVVKGGAACSGVQGRLVRHYEVV